MNCRTCNQSNVKIITDNDDGFISLFYFTLASTQNSLILFSDDMEGLFGSYGFQF